MRVRFNRRFERVDVGDLYSAIGFEIPAAGLDVIVHRPPHSKRRARDDCYADSDLDRSDGAPVSKERVR
jgi:hypothetical protein